MHAQTGPVVVEPAAQLRPPANQRLVRDVDPLLSGAATRGQHPRVDERVYDTVHHLAVCRTRCELIEPRAPPRVLRGLAWLCETQERSPRDLLLLRRERGEDPVRAPRERTADSARLAIRLERQHRPPAAAPKLEQRMLEERQRTRLVLDVLEDRVHEPSSSTRPTRRAGLDRLPQPLLVERGDERLVRGGSCAILG